MVTEVGQSGKVIQEGILEKADGRNKGRKGLNEGIIGTERERHAITV